MISDSIIADDVWAETPEDENEAFLFIALAARAKLDALSGSEADLGRYTLDDWRRQYIVELSVIADELGIGGLPNSDQAIQNASTMQVFDTNLARIITGIRAKKRDVLRIDAVKLPITTKNSIRDEIENLRSLVKKSNLSDRAKGRLLRKIDAVEVELDKTRSGLTAFWILAGAIGTIGSQTIGALADFPDAQETIQSIISSVNKAKSEENGEELALLAPPALQIEDKRGSQVGGQDGE